MDGLSVRFPLAGGPLSETILTVQLSYSPQDGVPVICLSGPDLQRCRVLALPVGDQPGGEQNATVRLGAIDCGCGWGELCTAPSTGRSTLRFEPCGALLDRGALLFGDDPVLSP